MSENKVFTENQQYLQVLLSKFNADPNDPDLDTTVRLLLNEIQAAQKKVVDLSQEAEKIRSEMSQKLDSITQQIIHKQGESQGYTNLLLKLRNNKE
jgi:hypothetical protein